MKRVMLVEDDPMFRTMIAELLWEKGVAVKEYETTERAFSVLEGDSEFDLVITDNNLGDGVSGTEFTLHVTQIYNLPVYMCSGDEGVEELFKRVGGKKFYPKCAATLMVKEILREFGL